MTPIKVEWESNLFKLAVLWESNIFFLLSQATSWSSLSPRFLYSISQACQIIKLLIQIIKLLKLKGTNPLTSGWHSAGSHWKATSYASEQNVWDVLLVSDLPVRAADRISKFKIRLQACWSFSNPCLQTLSLLLDTHFSFHDQEFLKWLNSGKIQHVQAVVLLLDKFCEF